LCRKEWAAGLGTMPGPSSRPEVAVSSDETEAGWLADYGRVPFNRLLRRFREARQLRQVDLGVKSYMDASTVSRLESGQRQPESSDVARLAAALRLDEAEHDALRLAFEREVLKVRAPLSDTLVDPAAALTLISHQIEAVRAVRSARNPALA